MKYEDLEIYIPVKKPPSNFKDLTNTENEYFKIINRAPSKNGTTRWNCQCKACGNFCVKDISNLKKHKSCGCERNKNIGKALRKDLTNQKFGKLTAIKYANKSNKNGNAIWVCKCDCGKLCEVDSNNLTTLHTYSCGCIKYSIGVQNILSILKNNNILYQLEYPIEGMNKGHPYRFDFAIFNNDNKVIRFIEFDGEQHFKETSKQWTKNSTLLQIQERDKKKNEYALNNNIPLVRIPYWERDNITLELLMGDKYLVK